MVPASILRHAPGGRPRFGLTSPIVPADNTPTIGLDLGRHRTLCITDVEGHPSIIGLATDHDGLIMRWVDPHGHRHRVTDRIIDTAGIDQTAAVDVAQAIAACVFPEGLPTAPRIAIPCAFGPACRGAMVEGFGRAGIELRHVDLVERPVAGFAAWLEHRRRLGSPEPCGPMLLIDNDGGQLSACAIDADARRIVFTTPLTTGPTDPMADVVDRLRVVVRELDRLRSDHDIVRSCEWSRISASISQIAVTGSRSNHPRFVELLNRVLPAAAIVRDPVATEGSEVVAFGLASLRALDTWSAGWPTLHLLADDALIRPAGPVDGTHTDHPAAIDASATLRLADPDGEAVPMRLGGIVADGIRLPADLGPTATVRVMSDGRVLVLGPVGTTPVTISVAWPLSGPSIVATVSVAAVGRRPLELVNPRDDRSRRTTAS